MKRKYSLFLVVLVFMLLIWAAPANAKLTKQQKQVKSAVTKLMKYCLDYDAAKIRQCFVNPSSIKVFYENKQVAKFMKKINQRDLSWYYQTIKVKSDTATVTMSIDFCNCYEMYFDVFDDIVEYMIYHPSASTSQVRDYTYKRMIYYYKSYDKHENYDWLKVKLNLKKVGNTWKVISMPAKFNYAIHGDYQRAYNDYFD